jgi:hypothetical protein
MIMKILCTGAFILLSILIQGCRYPDPAAIEQTDSRPAIGISGAPLESALYVDGLRMGMATQYDGTEQVLLIESGKHLIEVKSADGTVIHSETVFLSNSATKVLAIKP